MVYTMEYYIALKKKEILSHATTWTNLENIMSSSQSRKGKSKTLFHLHEVSKLVKLSEPESRMMVVRGWGKGGKEELLFNGYRVSVLPDKKVLEICCTRCT